MTIFNWFKKKIKPTNVETSIKDAVKNVNEQNELVQEDAGQITISNNPGITISAGGLVQPNRGGHIQFGPPTLPTKEKRVSKVKAEEYVARIEVKIATLIRQRIGKNGIEKDTLDISISTLEMTRDLVKQVFLDEDE